MESSTEPTRVRRGRWRRSFVGLSLVSGTLPAAAHADVEARVSALLGKMTVAEKIGQISQFNGADGEPGAFHAWTGGGSDADLQAEFKIIQPTKNSPVPVE